MEEGLEPGGATLATAAEAIGRLKVGQILGTAPLGGTPCHTTLRAAAEAVLGSGRSATAVVDEGGNVVGLLTENDIVRAYFEGEPPGDGSVGAWLMGGMARAPRQLLRRLAARPENSLLEVAERMVANAVAGDTACHHVVVEDETGVHCGVLSSSDLVQLLCHRGGALGDQGGSSTPLAGDTTDDRDVAEVTVREAMKPREAVFTCEPESTLRHVLKVLLVTRQNSVLIADDDGIHGIFTTRDAIRAFIEATDSTRPVNEQLTAHPSGTRPPSVTCDDNLRDAAAIMASHSASHVVVVKPGSAAAMGVLSSLDILLCLNRDMALLPLARTPTGPAVAGCASAGAACAVGATLGDAADLLLSSGRTVAPLLDSDGELAGVVTEGDLLKAFVAGCSRGDGLDQWLAGQEIGGAQLLEQLVVRPATPLLEVAALMCSAAEGGGRMCSHLVVKGDGGKCQGILCALDLMKALCGLRTALDVAQTGADQTTVASVMRSRGSVPTCRPGDSLVQALDVLIGAKQNAALVLDEAGVHGLVTPRWALQALAEDVSRESAVASWLDQHPGSAPKEISPDACLAHVASVMTAESLHHLVAAAHGEPASGVLSSLDVVRGIASMSCFCPFVSLGWLRLCKGPASCTCKEA